MKWNRAMKPAIPKLLLGLHFCGSLCVLLALVACVRGFEPSKAQAEGGKRVKSDMKTPSQNDVEFNQVKVERTDQGRFFGHYIFRNRSQRAISIPWVTFKSEGVGVPNEIGFEVLVNGKWKNPGYYRDSIPMQTTLAAGKEVTLQVEVPAHLWNKETPFRLLFGKYASVPSRLDAIK